MSTLIGLAIIAALAVASMIRMLALARRRMLRNAGIRAATIASVGASRGHDPKPFT